MAPWTIQRSFFPVTEPETEWIRGRALQKVSPTRSHALLQKAIALALDAWAGSRGEVGTEWRFRLTPVGAARRPLVPDVAYVSIERLRGLEGDELEVPRLAPDVAVEILSPRDRRPDVDDKIATYLAAGSSLVIVIESQKQIVELHDGHATATLGASDTLSHAALPGFRLDLGKFFESIAPPR